MNVSVNIISSSNNEVSSLEDVEGIISPFFLEFILGHFLGFSGPHDCVNKSVEFVVSVESVPH